MRLRVPAILALTLLRAFAAPEFDLVIRNAAIIDGTGAARRSGDVAVKGGRVAAIGTITGTADHEFDAKGLVVAPGFIDVHTHAEDVRALPKAENFVRMGVTTVVMGNCGSSVTNVGELFAGLEKHPVSINVATLIGHGSVREAAMGGRFDRPPSAAQLLVMTQLVARAMEDGAVGLSTGLIYLPGTFATTEEIIELAKVAGIYHGLYASHMRSESGQIMAALNELFRISREGGLPGHVSHIKLSGRANWGETAKVLQAIEQARAEGLRITEDQYGYTASSTSLSTLIPKKFREGGHFAEHYANAETRAEMIAQMKSPRERNGAPDYSYAVIAEFKKNKALNGLNIKQAAKKLRGNDALDDQVQTILEIQSKGGASAVFHGINEADVQIFMQQSNTMFASDSGVRRFKEGVPHPRGYGNNARILSRYVRDLHVLTLEEAVRRMTSLPAATFALRDRGVIREGYWADLVIFDPAKVRDNSTFDDPHHYATGLARVYVNGVAVVEKDKHTGARSGQPVRRGE